MEIRRISKYSRIVVVPINDIEKIHQINASDEKVIQVVKDEHFVVFEYIPNNMIESYLLENTKHNELTPTDKETPFDAQPQKTQQQKDLETALDTQLINDPLGRYNGCNLREPFDRGDVDWIEWVLKNMHNKFIRDKVALIKASNYGNINS